MTITFVTGNKSKLAEFTRMAPAGFEFTSRDLDLDEIQSLDLEAIVKDKAQRAYDIVGSPVIVEDVAGGLECLGGLPGPFIKYFNEKLGQDSLWQLAGDNKNATVICTICYYDGEQFVIGYGELSGTVVAARTTHGFGFDNVFVPNGHKQTFAELGPDIKDSISHRGQAVRDLLAKLEKL